MEDFKSYTWADYWLIFDRLIELLKSENKEGIVLDFKNAQKYVNGLTDGWYGFKDAFEKSYLTQKPRMTPAQIKIADFLILKLNESLENR